MDTAASRNQTLANSFQATPLRTGLLLGVQPWAVESGHDPYTLKPRALAGMELFDLTNTTFRPSVMIGGSITFPIIESAKITSTSLALGAFWEFGRCQRG